MKKLFLIPLAITCIASGMQQPKVSAQACATYKSYLHSKLHPTTVTFYQCHPATPDSQIIQRYVDEFVRMATQSPTTNITLAHCKEVWEATPSDPDIMEYILTGNRCDDGGMGIAACPDQAIWQEKLAEVQNRIKRMAAQRVKQIILNEQQIAALSYDVYIRLMEATKKSEIKINQEA